MVDIAIVTPRRVPEDWLRDLVQSFGGDWGQSPNRSGRIQQGQAYVEVDVEYADDYPKEYLTDLGQRVGFEPCTVVAVHYGVSSGSKSLAIAVAQRVRTAWGGEFVEA